MILECKKCGIKFENGKIHCPKCGIKLMMVKNER